MVFHSHQLVTDETTGVVYNLCYYKGCKFNILSEEPEEANGTLANFSTKTRYINHKLVRNGYVVVKF